MQAKLLSLAVGLLVLGETAALPASRAGWWPKNPWKTPQHRISNVELGPRPYYLVNDMEEGWLKDRLSACSEMEFRPTKFSIGHRGGAPMQFPEETVESIMAGTRMGAGVQECDVAFTKDRELVCRHDQCDLHYTTNIVTIPALNAKCTQPFAPARNGTAASAKCCTSDLTRDEFKSLCGKMEGFNATATTPEDFLGGTPAWRTDLYATCGTVLTHKEYIALVDGLGLDFTPELKQPAVPMPFGGPGSDYTQARYAQQLIDEYRAAGIHPSRVWPQSFQFADVQYWIDADPDFGRQAVLLDESGETPETLAAAVARLASYRASGVRIVAPPLPYLVTVGGGDDGNNKKKKIVPSPYALEAKRLGLKVMTWSLERSGPLSEGGGYYYGSIANVTDNDGDVYTLVDVLAREVGVIGIFSDWSATVTYYANCFGFF